MPKFDRVVLLEEKAATSANVAIGDVNSDGNLDLVLAKGRHWPLVNRVLLGDGHGHFPQAYDLGTVADRSYSARLADLDGDGALDVVVSNDAPDPKLVYLNDGKGHFRAGSTYGHAAWPTRNAAVADLDGDGLPDIVVANRFEGEGANYVCLNRGHGKFDADCIAFSHEPATTITAADFDHDGRIDLVVPHRDGGQSYVYLQTGKKGFPDFRRVPFGPADAAFRMAEVADIDGDGLLDIVAIDERRGVTIYFGQPGGTFSAGLPLADGKAAPYALAVGDLNLDGRIDIVVGHVEAPSTLFLNDGTGRRFTPIHFGDNQGTVYGFAIGDLDKDGWPDIAVARSEAPNVVYFGGVTPSHSAVQKSREGQNRSAL
ncbi:MAG TPA: VCBS repeat-containing protein [Thermoanaerobaculia bacterium]|nr:VCBS repeat-containing protein [Thermoanaerobaculia bacterium]